MGKDFGSDKEKADCIGGGGRVASGLTLRDYAGRLGTWFKGARAR